MSDYFDELGVTPTGDEGANDFHKHYKRLQVLAVMNGIDMEIQVPEASKRAIEAMPMHEIKAGEEEQECAVCQIKTAQIGDKFKVLPCKHEFHEECILLWLKKANSCPMCRYEIETDDPVYEELRQFRNDASNRRLRQENLMDSMFS